MAEAHDAVEVIIAKRERGELTDSQIDWVVDAYTRGAVADEQMSSLAMAILLNGMNRREISRWTAAMIASGERMDFSSLSRPTADKHSTGGVGDKITLPLAPLVAACGVAVPQLSGRGLGHTGGTLDKLEAIPGWRADLSNQAMLDQLEEIGAVICAAGTGLAPADKKLYALRDVTGTVEAIPLIASSIMSKKIAEGTGALVLDVKVGSGAFMKDADLRARARRDDGRARHRRRGHHGRPAHRHVHPARPDRRQRPRGPRVRRGAPGRRPGRRGRADPGAGPGDAHRRRPVRRRPGRQARRRLGVRRLAPDDRRPGRRPRRDPADRAGDHRGHRARRAACSPVSTRWRSGLAAWRLGAGRARKEDPVQAGAGVEMHAKPGDTVTAGEPLLTLHTDEPERFERALASLEGGIEIGDGAGYDPTPLVIDRIS